MAALANLYFKLETLEEIVSVVKEKQKTDPTQKGFKATLSISDTTNEHGQNVTIFAEQNKEQIAAKTPRYYVANGGVYWADSKPVEKAVGKATKLADAYQPQPSPATAATAGQPAAAQAAKTQPTAAEIAANEAANKAVQDVDLPF